MRIKFRKGINMTREKRIEAIIENLIALHEVQAPREDIDVAVIEARRVKGELEKLDAIDNLKETLDDFFKDCGTLSSVRLHVERLTEGDKP